MEITFLGTSSAVPSKYRKSFPICPHFPLFENPTVRRLQKIALPAPPIVRQQHSGHVLEPVCCHQAAECCFPGFFEECWKDLCCKVRSGMPYRRFFPAGIPPFPGLFGREIP